MSHHSEEKVPPFYLFVYPVIFSLSFGLFLLLPGVAGASSCNKSLTRETQASRIEKTRSSLSNLWTPGRVLDFIQAKQFGERFETDQELHDFLQELREPLFQALDSRQISYRVLDTEKLILEILPNTTSRLGGFVSQLHDFKRLKIIYDPSTLIQGHIGAFFRPSKNLGSYTLLNIGHDHLLLDFVNHLIVHELIHAEIHEKRGTHPFLQIHFRFGEDFFHNTYQKYFSTEELLTYSYINGFLAERLIKGSVKAERSEFQRLQKSTETLRVLTLATSKFNKELLQLSRFIFSDPSVSSRLIRNDGLLFVFEGPWSAPFQIEIKQNSNHSLIISLETSRGRRVMEFSGPRWWVRLQKFKEYLARSCLSDFCSFQPDSPHWPFFSKVIEEVQMRVMELEQLSGKIIPILDQIADKESTINFMAEQPDPVLVREYLELNVELKELASQQGLPKVEKFVEESFSEEKN